MPPMRRIGLLVTWELLDPLHPGRDAGEACLEVIKAQLQWSCFGAPRRPQQELQARIGDDIVTYVSGTDPDSLAGGPGFEPRLTESESAVLPLNYPPARSPKHRTNR